MKSNIKRVLAFAVVLVMTVSFAGCRKTTTEYSSYWEEYSDYGDGTVTTVDGDKTTSDAQTTTGGQTTTTTTTTSGSGTTSSDGTMTWKQMLAQMPSSLKGTTLTVGNWNDISDVPGLKQLISDFTKQTGIKVKWHKFAESTIGTELAQMVAAQNAPDIVRMKYFDPAVMVSLQPLSNTGWDFSTSEWDQEVLKHYTVNGKQYAVNMQNTLLQQPSCMIYNTKLIAKYDLEDPYTLWKQGKWTWNKFVELCEDYLEVCGDGCYPYSMYNAMDYANITGMSAVEWDGTKFVSNMQNSQFLEANLVQADLLSKGITQTTWFDRNGFEQGKVLFFCESLIGARTTHYYFSDLKSTNSIDAVPYPTVEGKENYQYYGEYEAYAVPKGAKNVAAVPYFLRYYLDAENYDEKTFFANSHMLEVHKAMRANTKTYSATPSAVFTADTGMEAGKFISKLHSTKAAQMKTVLDEYSSVANAAVAACNKIMQKMG